MPKAFNSSEKAIIRTQLLEVGFSHFSKAGVRAARIDDICRDVSIAKGSFYAFFSSKEDLFMTIVGQRDIMHKSEMIAELQSASGDRAQILTDFFDTMMERIETDPVLKIVRDTSEIAHLMRKIPPQDLVENTRRDREFMAKVVQILQQQHNLVLADATELEGFLTLMLSVSLQAAHLKPVNAYQPTIKLLRELFLSRLINGAINDQR